MQRSVRLFNAASGRGQSAGESPPERTGRPRIFEIEFQIQSIIRGIAGYLRALIPEPTQPLMLQGDR